MNDNVTMNDELAIAYEPRLCNGFLDDIAIADKKVREFTLKHPEVADRFDACFLKLRRTECSDILYPSHIDELLQRIVNNEPLDKLTEAEMLSLMSKVNQFISLPGNEFTAAIKLLFSKLVDHDSGIVQNICDELEERTGSKWNDEAHELIAQFKNKFSIKFRS